MSILRIIRNFPSPYPGECLYSLLSRYHARSGNASFENTAEDLFGNHKFNFHSAVTTPYRLEFVKRWYPQNTELFAKHLLLYHTGFQYYSLKCSPKRRDEFYNAFCMSVTKNYKPAAFIFREISHNLNYLRYCPVCAREEIRLYGEAYWSVNAQIDGVEFCPVHDCRLINSPVSIDNTRRALIPASQVLTKKYLDPKRVLFATSPLELECLDFSKDVQWFLNHGASVDYDLTAEWIITGSYVKNPKRGFLERFEKQMFATERILNLLASSEMLKKIQALYISQRSRKIDRWSSESYYYAYFLPTKVLAIHHLSGSAEKFGKTVLG